MLEQFDFEKKVSEYQNTHLFQVETARREHDSLSKTLRDRLINSITAKKNRLNREKEALEISDASALLLHPNQFSITNPVSPGGTHGKRSTRQRREADDANGSDSRKRKRNGGEDDGSPGPQRRALDPATSTPIWQTDRLTKRKTTGPIYSIDKLFTDKELSLTYNTAALSAHKHLLTHKPRVDEHGNFVSSPEASDETGDHEDDVSDVPLAAPTMERNVSHATRSARGGNHHQNFTDNKILGLDVLANFDLPGNFERRIAADPKLPPTFPSNYVRNHGKGAEMNTPTPFTADLVDHDLSLMGMYSQYDTVHGQGSSFDEFGARKILEVAAAPVHENRYVAYLHADRPSENEVRKRLGLPVVAPPETLSERGHHDGGGTPSKTGRSGTPAHSPSKPGGLSGVSALPGGISMSRQSSAGWAPMSRSSSRQKGRAARGV